MDKPIRQSPEVQEAHVLPSLFILKRIAKGLYNTLVHFVVKLRLVLENL
jgi:hypothetical protein